QTMSNFRSITHQNQFTESIHYVFLKWTALQLVIEHSMGGSSTLQKVQLLGEYIVDFFAQNGNRIDASDLEDNLINYFQESFRVELEDGSAIQIAMLLCRLFSTLESADLSEFERVKVLAAIPLPESMKSRRVSAGNGEADDDNDSDNASDDSLDEDGNNIYEADAMETAENSKAVRESVFKPEPIIDEDGFEMVQQKNRRRR
ncbi:hypothetical protein HK100_004153, partial [Physocladia obscura]